MRLPSCFTRWYKCTYTVHTSCSHDSTLMFTLQEHRVYTVVQMLLHCKQLVNTCSLRPCKPWRYTVPRAAPRPHLLPSVWIEQPRFHCLDICPLLCRSGRQPAGRSASRCRTKLEGLDARTPADVSPGARAWAPVAWIGQPQGQWAAPCLKGPG